MEEHIAGVPGDVFIRDYLGRDDLNRVRIAKEFVKFSERCFIRLLGDMRSYNYVMDVTRTLRKFSIGCERSTLISRATKAERVCIYRSFSKKIIRW